MYNEAMRKKGGKKTSHKISLKVLLHWYTQRIRWAGKAVSLSSAVPAHRASQGISYAKLHDSSYLCVLTTAIAMEYTLVRQMYKHFS